jgi:16S rRNA (cytidine1402-2'-O)-methyltransferase
MGKLYIVPTPIGNLEDITFRAVKVLKSVDLILAEDTRTTKKLLNHYEINNKLQSFHIHNEHKVLENVLQQIETLNSVALVSDAGTPGISDPGFLLIRACKENNIEISCLPGPSALIPALVASGIPCDRFIFEGFLPHKKGRQTKWKEIAAENRTVALYESPHRLLKCLKEIETHLGSETIVCVAREISKIHEEFNTNTCEQLIAHYTEKPPKGEIVVIIAPKI